MQLKLNIELPPELSEALQRFAEEKSWSIEMATMATIAGWLSAHGYLRTQSDEAPRDAPTEGSA